MDRPIRFRGRAYYSGSWVYGFYFITGRYDAQIWQDKEDSPVKVDFRTVGEYTGKDDEDGREIYEGDILSCWYDKPVLMRNEHVWPHEEFEVSPEARKQEVYWEDGSFKIFDHGTHDWMLLGVADTTKTKVIGNIHEHPGMVPSERERRSLKMIWR